MNSWDLQGSFAPLTPTFARRQGGRLKTPAIQCLSWRSNACQGLPGRLKAPSVLFLDTRWGLIQTFTACLLS